MTNEILAVGTSDSEEIETVVQTNSSMTPDTLESEMPATVDWDELNSPRSTAAEAPAHGWVAPGDGTRSWLAEQCRLEFANGADESAVERMIELGESLITVRNLLDRETVVRVVAGVIVELTT